MSWFKKRPTVKTPPKPQAHHYSPTAERLLKEAKKKYRPSDYKENPNKD